MSGSQAKTSTQESQSTNVRNLNLQDTGGFTIADNKGPTTLNYSTTTTDQGAVRAGQAVAEAGISGGVNAVNSAINLASDAISGNTNTTNSAFLLASGLSSDVSHAAVTLGQTALDSGTSLAHAGLDNAAAAYEAGLTFQNDALSTVANIAQDSLLHQESLTSNAISGFQSIAQQNSASDSTQVQKIAIYAVMAAAAIVVLPALFKNS